MARLPLSLIGRNAGHKDKGDIMGLGMFFKNYILDLFSPASGNSVSS